MIHKQNRWKYSHELISLLAAVIVTVALPNGSKAMHKQYQCTKLLQGF
jgi:hypothetical protein